MKRTKSRKSLKHSRRMPLTQKVAKKLLLKHLLRRVKSQISLI
jgi:hypothetical protein